MLIDGQNFTGCDWCGDPAKRCTHGDVARGATGRHCVVMARCSDCVGDNPVVPIDEARQRVSVGGDWADF